MANASTLPVAVVIPCFNDGSTVMEAVESALAEVPAEIVVVNDGSTDPRTLVAFQAVRARGVRVLDQANAGLSAARMAGVRATTSPFVMVLDADDCVAPGALRLMSQALDHDPGLAVVWGDIERIGQPGYLRYSKGLSLDPWRITFVNELVASTMVRRTALEECGGWQLRSAFEDWDLWMTMAERGMRGRHVGQVTLLYRVADARMYQRALRDYAALVQTLRERHRPLFARRALNRRASQTRWSVKAAWTILGGLPMPESLRRYALFGALVTLEPRARRRRWPGRPHQGQVR
jgi:glycosyltransferase involved in cell wall biosynthesis